MYLEKADEDYRKNGTLLTSSKIKADILDKLAETMYMYTAYLSNPQICDVVQKASLSERAWLVHRLLWLATKLYIQDGKLSHQTQRLRCSRNDVQCLEAQECC